MFQITVWSLVEDIPVLNSNRTKNPTSYKINRTTNVNSLLLTSRIHFSSNLHSIWSGDILIRWRHGKNDRILLQQRHKHSACTTPSTATMPLCDEIPMSTQNTPAVPSPWFQWIITVSNSKWRCPQREKHDGGRLVIPSQYMTGPCSQCLARCCRIGHLHKQTPLECERPWRHFANSQVFTSLNFSSTRKRKTNNLNPFHGSDSHQQQFL